MDFASRPDFLPPVLLLQSTLETVASDHAKIRIWRKVCSAPHVSSVYRINKCIPSLSLVWPWFLLQGHFSLIPLLDLTLNPCWVTGKPLNLPFSFMSQAFAFKDFFLSRILILPELGSFEDHQATYFSMQPLLTGFSTIPLLFTWVWLCSFTCQSPSYESLKVKDYVLNPVSTQCLSHVWVIRTYFKGIQYDLDKMHLM